MPYQDAQPQATPVTVQPSPAPTLPSTPATAAEMYEALRAQGRVLDGQLNELEHARDELADQLRNPIVTGADRAGLESRLAQLDSRISQIEAQRLTSDQQIALAAGQPGAVIVRPDPPDSVADEVLAFGAFMSVIILFPLTIAWARRIWRRQTVVQAIPPELGARLVSIERAVDAVAVEVERIGEGQRFVTQLMSTRREGEAQQLPHGRP
jgi:hypothetical protein